MYSQHVDAQKVRDHWTVGRVRAKPDCVNPDSQGKVDVEYNVIHIK